MAPVVRRNLSALARVYDSDKGAQSDQAFVRDLAGRVGPFDVIIDDGSHINAHVRASFQALFVDHLNPGGFYIVEDMSTAYLTEYGGGPPGYPGTSAELVGQLVHDVNRVHWAGGTGRPVRSVHIYDKIAFIEKS